MAWPSPVRATTPRNYLSVSLCVWMCGISHVWILCGITPMWMRNGHMGHVTAWWSHEPYISHMWLSHIHTTHLRIHIWFHSYVSHTCRVYHTCVTCVTHESDVSNMRLLHIHMTHPRIHTWHHSYEWALSWFRCIIAMQHQIVRLLLLLPLLFSQKLARSTSMCSLDLHESTLMLILSFWFCLFSWILPSHSWGVLSPVSTRERLQILNLPVIPILISQTLTRLKLMYRDSLELHASALMLIQHSHYWNLLLKCSLRVCGYAVPPRQRP